MSKFSFEKSDKKTVINWIEKQFASDSPFPEKCCEKNRSDITDQHIKAYKKWRKLSPKRGQIVDWIEDWLSKSEIEKLESHITKKRKAK